MLCKQLGTMGTLQRQHAVKCHPVGPLARVHLPHKYNCQAWVVNTGVRGGLSMHHTVRHGFEKQQESGGRGVRGLHQLLSCGPFLNLETLVPLKHEIVHMGFGQRG